MRLIIVIVVVAIATMGCSSSDQATILEVDAELAGEPAARSGPTRPIELHHQEITELVVEATNVSPQAVTVAHVRLEGQLLDLIFLTYDTGIRETIQPGEQRTLAFPIDFFDLNGQAHGFLRSQITLFDTDRQPLGQQELVVDGRGSPFATMTMFTLVLATLAAASLGWNLLRLAQRRLPTNGFARGLRLTHSGAGIGLAAAAASSTLRVWPLTTTAWVIVAVSGALFGFVAGYLSPGSDGDVDELVIDLADRPLHTMPPLRAPEPHRTGSILGPG